MKPVKDRTPALKVESEPFPIKLKSVLIPPKSHPLLGIPIRGGYSCQKTGYDPFVIRLGFDFTAGRPRLAPPWALAGWPGFARNIQKQ